MKTAIFACACNENLYIRDWVAYHITLGFDSIIIADNSPQNGGEYPERVLGDFIESGKVKVFDFRKKEPNPDLFQAALYTAAFWTFRELFDWIFFIDIDEFVTFNKNSGYNNVKDFLSLPEISQAEQIKMNWMCMSDNDQLHYDSKPVWIRFPKSIEPIDNPDWWGKVPVNYTIKTAVNCNKTTRADFISSMSPHFPITDSRENTVCISPSGKSIFWKSAVATLDYDVMFLRHYRTLTIEEFLFRRVLSQGDDNCMGGITGKETLKKLFCVDNKMTPEKEKIFDDFFMRFPRSEKDVLAPMSQQDDSDISEEEKAKKRRSAAVKLLITICETFRNYLNLSN